MADDGLHCSVITPEGKAFEGPAEEVIIPAHDGEIGILHDHAPLVCKLGAGTLRINENTTTVRLFIEGGFCQVVDNQVTVLTQYALTPEKLDRANIENMLNEAKRLPARDEIEARRKADLETSARAKLRLLSKL